MTTGLAGMLGRLLGPHPPPFALLHRPEATGKDHVDLVIGEVSTSDTVAEIPLRDDHVGPGHDVLAIVPYRQIAERGFACVDDGAPLITMRVAEQAVVPIRDVLALIPDVEIRLTDGRFDVGDDVYAETVRKVVAEEIERGEGANFVIKRLFLATIADYGVSRALTIFRRLCEKEAGAYWTFVVHTGARTFVGATPERHVSLRDGVAVMNPISGTYRYPFGGPTLAGVMEFLADGKETDELYMVLDEELKMMSRICDAGGRVVGPYLKEMARLAHTEYLIEGRCDRDPREVLRETMFAPTVTGSPVESACRVIRRYEPEGRGYYSGAIALFGRDDHGGRSMDSAILIRTAEVDQDGQVRIGVGATLVRHSDPKSEVAETHAKVSGLLSALNVRAPVKLGEHDDVRAALGCRNSNLSGFWLADDLARDAPQPSLAGHRVLIVDAEDTFTGMIGHQLKALGLVVTVRRFDDHHSWDDHDLVVMGPGPGDPLDVDQPRISYLYSAIEELLARRRPFLAVCLSHQVLSRILGLDVVRCAKPNQGTQREIDLFGHRERVGFYNSFTACSRYDKVEHADVGPVEISRDTTTDEVHALRGAGFASMQFHAESVLTSHGHRILTGRIREVLGL